MKKLLLILWALAVATPLAAQPTHDDCPAGAQHMPPMSSIVRADIIEAYKASFRGLYNREPSMVRRSGIDDGGFWADVSDHYGPFGDQLCRIGWNAYWEEILRCQCGQADPKLGDKPARFQPDSSVQPADPPKVTPPTLPPVTAPLDLSGVQAQLDAIAAELHGLVLTDANEHSQILTETRGIASWLADHWKAVTAYLGSIVATYEATCRAAGKCWP